MSKSRITLYDLMNKGCRPSPDGGQHPHAHVDTELAEPGPGWFNPGRVFRIPVGFVLVAVAIVAGLLVAAFIVGYDRGQRIARARFEATYLEQSGLDRAGGNLTDPLADISEDRGTQPVSLGVSEDELGGGVPADRGATRIPDPPSWGPLFSDPREVGQSYFVLMETRELGARRLAEFCRSEGLETYVIRRHNTGLCRVVVLPGFRSGERSSPAVKQLESRIHAVGDRWKSIESGASDLRDAYPMTFNG